MSERGESKITVLLADVTSEEIEALAEAFADLLVERGLGCEGEDGDVRSLVYVAVYEWPEPGELVRELREDVGASSVLIPTAEHGQEAA